MDDYHIFQQVFHHIVKLPVLLESERLSSYNELTGNSSDLKIDLFQIRETLILDEGTYRGSLALVVSEL